ncbi:MAG: VWA domain-containing protein [Pseudomonadota bacterium]
MPAPHLPFKHSSSHCFGRRRGLTLLGMGLLLVLGCHSPQSQDTQAGAPPPDAAGVSSVASNESAATRVDDVAAETAVRRAAFQDKALAAPALSAPLGHWHPAPSPAYPRTEQRERYPDADPNPVKLVRDDPVSTFSIDVDSAAYANVRRLLTGGSLPTPDAVRVEEFINYFSYDYPQPQGDAPFSVTTEVAPSPWNDDRSLLLVGLQGLRLAPGERKPANLVFLVDVSGSMNAANKLPLLQKSLELLTRELGERDRVSIVAYAGAAGEVLAPTAGDETRRIRDAIAELRAGGSTNGGAGIELAYRLAGSHHDPEAINRVILATDGDFNVGTTDQDALRRLVERKRRAGISLTVLGFGAGNYNDALMQELAQIGDGNAAYIDSIAEARRVLVDELGGTLQTIAKDVKIQVEFNPGAVREYRLLGYETRMLAREDFNNDAVDAGDIGAGHAVTALYELTLSGAANPSIDDLRYGAADAKRAFAGEELAYVKLRYKAPGGGSSRLLERAVTRDAAAIRLDGASRNLRFAAAAAGFAELLRGAPYLGDFGYAELAALAEPARGRDRSGYRSEFLQLVRTAQSLDALQDPLASR